MRLRGILAIGLLALPLAGCAPLAETVTWDEWAGAHAAEGGFALYDGLVQGGAMDGTGASIQHGNDLFVNLPLDASRIDLFCRSMEPVTFQVADLEPIEVDCDEGATVEIEVRSGTRVTARPDGRAYWLAVARADADAIDCEDCEFVEPGAVRFHEADAFVDGEPVDGSDEAPSEP